MNTQDSIALYFREGRSDKVYQIQLKPCDHSPGLWVVNFQYGRRGSSLRTGTKTESPVTYHNGFRIYDKLARSKIAKGYTPKTDGKAYSAPLITQEPTGFQPQLLNSITEKELLDLWGKFPMLLQTKHDGERRAISFTKEGIVPSNRKGLKTAVQQNVLYDLETYAMADNWHGIWDCEDMGDYLIVFDLIPGNGNPIPFSSRAQVLKSISTITQELGLQYVRFDLPFIPKNTEDVQIFIDEHKENNAEGIVIRDGNSVYSPGRPNSGGPCLKLKFVESATVKVEEINIQRSIAMCVLNESKDWVHIGNCTIPPNYDLPKIGDLIEVQYLYAYPNGSLYQPVYKGKRYDVTEAAANTEQLKYKI
jgi:bifunctional non-homologous end joining protein LigD